MKIFSLSVIAALVLAGPSASLADTIYYKLPRTTGLQTISGTIIEETGSAVKIQTADGKSHSISKADVFEIIRDTPSAEGEPVEAEPFASRAAALAGDPAAPGGASWRRPAADSGILAGMNIANLRVDPEELEDTGSLRSMAAGIWWDRSVSRLSLRTEILFSMKGDAESASGYTALTRIGYLEIAPLAALHLLPESAVRPSLFVGPSLGAKLSASSKLEGDGTDASVGVKDQLRALDAGFVVGGLVDLRIRERSYGVEVRWSRGLTNATSESANGDAQNSVLSVLGSIGLR